ncbi:MAG TPA: FtsX-like permease family protein [Dehalococcoidia bacterium]|nr:FtsX-like permease family protein [Dehalococcoidia bacterium]
MGGLLTVIPIVIRRVSANSRLLLAVIAGAVLAAAIMSTTSIYTDAIRDLGLAYALRQRGPDKINLVVRSSSQSSLADTYAKNEDFIEATAKRVIGPVIEGSFTRIGRSATFFPTAPGQPVPRDDNRPRAHFNFVTGLEAHVNLEGRMPSNATAPPGRAPAVEAAVGGETARRLAIRVGDAFDLYPFWMEDAAPVRVTVVGIVDPKDPKDEFWVGQNDFFYFPTSSWETIPFLITQETFFNAIAAYLPSMTSDYTTLIYVDQGDINARNAERVRRSLESYGNQLNSNVVRTSIATELPEVLATFDEKLFFTRIPLLVLVLQIAAIVLYYLYMVSTMLVERQSGEIALLKSRGATTPQVMRIYVIEGLAILVVALLVGPPLAATVISFLGRTPPFADLSQGSNLQVHLSSGAYLWAASGAALAFVTLLLPAFQATRRTVIQQRAAASRPPKQPFFLRYYLDLGLVGVGAFLLYQLDRRGSLVSERLFGEHTVDPVLLLTPAFFILTVGIVFLRLFPVALRLLAWLVARAQGAAMLIGMWQLVRNPVHYSRLVLLLMLATAVGMFAASFGATLERSYEDRAYYQSGADLRLSEMRQLPAAGPLEAPERLKEALAAEHASPVYRMDGSQGSIANRVDIQILGVDPDTLANVAYFRRDFAAGSLDSLLKELRPESPPKAGVELPADARWLGIWVNPVEMPSAFGLEMEVRDATGRYFSYIIGPDTVTQMPPGWHLLVSDLSRPGTNFPSFGRPGPTVPPNGPYVASLPQPPLTLTSIVLRSPTRLAPPSGVIQFDDVQTSSLASIGDLASTKLLYDPDRALGGLPGAAVVIDFDSARDWVPIQGQLPEALNDQVSEAAAPGGGRALEMRWAPQRGQVTSRGIQFAATAAPIDALASDGFLHQSRLKVGDITDVFINPSFVKVRIVGSFRLFPTLEDPRTKAAMLLNGDQLGVALNANPRGPLIYPDEMWVKGPARSVEAARELFAGGGIQGQLVSFEELRLAQKKDPLVAAGWEGILFVSFAAILILSAIGFLIYSYLTAQRRTLEFAVLRTMGFSKRQIAAVVGFEQLFVIGLGMAAGTLVGLRLGSLMIRYMGLTETGDEVLPPMQLQISWFTVGTAWLVLGVVFLATIGAVVLLYARLQLHRVLRIGEA